MFKKIEIWILYLTILLSFLFAIGFGVMVRQELVGGVKAGWVSRTALFLAEIPMNLKRVMGNRDLIVEDRFPSLDDFNGIPNAEESYLLLSRYDGDLQKGLVELVDLSSFEILHTWNPDFDAFNDMIETVDEFKYLKRDNSSTRARLVHPKLLQDGGLLFQDLSPLRKIDACSNLVFQDTHDKFHHSIETDIDGNIWAATFLYPQSLPVEKVGRDVGGFIDDAIVKLSSSGEILFKKSVAQIFLDNGLEYLIFAHGNDYEEDPIHLNDIQPVNVDGEFWKKGDVFLSLRNQSMIVLYRPATNEIIWEGAGPFFHQHDVDILDNHRISIFNNRSINIVGDINVVDGHNEVVIYDFKSDEYSKYLNSSLVKNDVRTIAQGRSQILSNGDLFIEESNYGRTLYFNSDGSLRWTHVNRADNGKVFGVAWSRILYTDEDIRAVNDFLIKKGACN